jgi:hypothetical protein
MIYGSFPSSGVLPGPAPPGGRRPASASPRTRRRSRRPPARGRWCRPTPAPCAAPWAARSRCPGLGGEERLEDGRGHVRRDAGAVVGHADVQLVPVPAPGGDADAAVARPSRASRAFTTRLMTTLRSPSASPPPPGPARGARTPAPRPWAPSPWGAAPPASPPGRLVGVTGPAVRRAPAGRPISSTARTTPSSRFTSARASSMTRGASGG